MCLTITEDNPCDWSLSAWPFSIRKAQLRKKKPTFLCAPHEFLRNMRLLWLIIETAMK